jgi:hypothetical protein
MNLTSFCKILILSTFKVTLEKQKHVLYIAIELTILQTTAYAIKQPVLPKRSITARMTITLFNLKQLTITISNHKHRTIDQTPRN